MTQNYPMLAIDGGGTKTEFILFTSDGRVVNRIKREGCNPNVCGIDKTIEILISGINCLCSDYPDIKAIYAGCAGFASGDYKDVALRELNKSFPQIPIKCDTDIMNVISAATDEDKCIVAICGTGMVVYAKLNDTLYRMGGWGYLLDKGGSGYTIGRDALRAALAEREGSGPKTRITEIIEQKLGSTVWEHIGKLYMGGNSYIASFAPIVTEAYNDGDKVAAEILKSNAAHLAEAIAAVSEKYDCGKNVVIAGSVITNDLVFRSLTKEKLPADLNLIVSELPAVYGACVECCKIGTPPSAEFRKCFIDSYKLFN